MRGFAAGILVSSLCSAPLQAQQRDRPLERVSLALQQPSSLVRDVPLVEGVSPTKVGIFTLVPPASRGEMIRVSIPVGELVTRGFKGLAAANHRRQETAARRRVEAELKAFTRAR